jgi:hypothetical protein
MTFELSWMPSNKNQGKGFKNIMRGWTSFSTKPNSRCKITSQSFYKAKARNKKIVCSKTYNDIEELVAAAIQSGFGIIWGDYIQTHEGRTR